MKKLLLALSLVFAVGAQAHTLKNLESATNQTLDDLLVMGEKASDNGILVLSYKIKAVSPKKTGESQADTFIRVAKYALHKDYPITGDDGGYDFQDLTQMSERQIVNEERSYDWLFDRSDDMAGPKLHKLIMKAIGEGYNVWLGLGSGNNTRAEMVLIADADTNEFVIVMSSNLGSDD